MTRSAILSRRAAPPLLHKTSSAAYGSMEVRAPRLPWGSTPAERVMAALHSLAIPVDVNIWVLADKVVTSVTVLENQCEQIERAVRGSSGWELYADETPDLMTQHGRQTRAYLLNHLNGQAAIPLRPLIPAGDTDPLGPVLEAVQPVQPDESVLIRLRMRPASATELQREAEELTSRVLPVNLSELTATLWGAAPRAPRFEGALQQRLEDRLREPCFQVTSVVALSGEDPEALYSRAQSLSAAFACSYQLGLQAHEMSTKAVSERPLIVTSSELATLWHPLSAGTAVPGVRYVERQTVLLPNQMLRPSADGLLLGEHHQRGRDLPVYLSTSDLKAGHAAIIGRTGTGKTTLIHQILRQLLAQPDRPGIALIDPHGDLVMDLIRHSIPEHRWDDVILVDTSDVEHPVGLPLFWRPARLSINTVVENTFALIRLLFREHWSASRMADLMFAVTATLCNMPRATLLDAPRLLSQPAWRQKLVRDLEDPVAVAFWREFDTLSPSARREMIRPVLYRLRSFYRAPAVRNLVCQPQGLDFLRLMDQGHILLVNLAGQEVTSEADLLGELVIARLHLAALARLSQPPSQRRPFFLAVDESQRFQGASLPVLLSEGRKLGLSLLLATQFVSGWDETLASSILGNVGTLVSFRAGVEDSRRLSATFRPYTPEQLENLDRHEAVVKLQAEGRTMPAFDLRTIRVQSAPDEHRIERVRNHTRRTYAVDRHQLEQTLRSSSPTADHLREDIDEE